MTVIRLLKNINLFIDGRGYAGKVDEFDPPKLTIKTEEFRAGGMDAPSRSTWAWRSSSRPSLCRRPTGRR